MEGYYEAGPPPPKNEAEKIGEALYLALKKRYLDYPEISKSYTAKGNPRKVAIIFEHTNTDTPTNFRDPLDEFRDDVQEIVASYDVPDKIHIEYETEVYLGKRKETITINLRETN